MIIERPALERRVIASLSAGRVPVLLGPCGTGRTSLLLRLESVIGPARAQYFNMAAAASTPERCLSSIRHALRLPVSASSEAPTSAKAAFDDVLRVFDTAAPAGGGPATFLLDEFLDVRTFESFPGLRHVQRELIAHLAKSPAGFVLASRFTARVHRLLRDAPARFEVIHMPPLEPAEARSLALMIDGKRPEWSADIAPAVTALANGHAGAARLLVETMASMDGATDPVAALAALFSPSGQLAARCRECYEFRLHRARGYGALKAILSVLAEHEPRNLTEIARSLQRTPGSTKDYLSWLEDVDLVTVQGKRYSFDDPLLRLYVRLYDQPVPPTDDDVVREIGAYARLHLPSVRPVPALTAPAAPTAPAETVTAEVVSGEPGRGSGIIEID